MFRQIKSTYNINILITNKMNISKSFEFDELINAVSIDNLYKKIVYYAQKRYLVKHLGLSTLSPPLVVKLIQRNLQKTNTMIMSQNKDEQPINETVWALNQFKIFIWVSVCHAYLKNRQLQNFNVQDWSFLKLLFSRKSLQFIQYHTKSIIKECKNVKKSWAQQQMDLLNEVIRTQKPKENLSWSQISFQLFLISQKRYYRTPQKCREKWFNHLNPQVNRDKWTVEQDLFLFNSIADYGLKWALISKKFDGKRTQHMIKNRYNSLIKKYCRKAQKNTSKKLTLKIISELSKKLNPLSSEQFGYQIQQQQQACEQQRSVKQGTFKIEEQDKETINQQKKLSSFDLEDILFNEKVELKSPKGNKQVQMVQIQIFREQPKQDEYLSAFLF